MSQYIKNYSQKIPSPNKHCCVWKTLQWCRQPMRKFKSSAFMIRDKQRRDIRQGLIRCLNVLVNQEIFRENLITQQTLLHLENSAAEQVAYAKVYVLGFHDSRQISNRRSLGTNSQLKCPSKSRNFQRKSHPTNTAALGKLCSGVGSPCDSLNNRLS